MKDEIVLTNITIEKDIKNTPCDIVSDSAKFESEMKNVLILFRLCPSRNEYAKVILIDGRVVGALIIGDIDLEEVLESLLISNTDLSFLSTRVLDPEIDLEDYFD